MASIALLCLADARALADCAPANPAPGGTVTCSGTDNDGYPAPVDTPVTINVLNGASVGGSGIDVSGSGDSFVNNDGTISGPSSVEFNGVAGFSKPLNNNGTLQSGIVGSGDGIIIINHDGVLNSGGITITGNGENRLNIFAGRSVNGLANITGARNFVDSQGMLNAGLTMTGTELNSVVIRPGSAASGTFSLTGPSNFIDNFGTFNSGITLTGDGSNLVINRQAGVMQGVTSTGAASDFFLNDGRANQAVMLGDGDGSLSTATSCPTSSIWAQVTTCSTWWEARSTETCSWVRAKTRRSFETERSRTPCKARTGTTMSSGAVARSSASTWEPAPTLPIS